MAELAKLDEVRAHIAQQLVLTLVARRVPPEMEGFPWPRQRWSKRRWTEESHPAEPLP